MKIPIEQAEAELSQIRQLMQHPGWKLVCERHAQGVKELTDAVLDATTDDLTATRLRHTRATVLALSPATIAGTYEAKLAAAVKKAAEQTT